MDTMNQRAHPAYKRSVIYFIVYSVGLFVLNSAIIFQIKSLLYFFVGFALGGIVARLVVMPIQRKIEESLPPRYWILNIFIDVVVYFAYTYALFLLMY